MSDFLTSVPMPLYECVQNRQKGRKLWRARIRAAGRLALLGYLKTAVSQIVRDLE